MKIGIDARFLTHPQTGGFKTYTRNLITALAKVDSLSEYILYLDRAPDRPVELPASPNFTFRVVPGLVPLIGMPWREQFRLARQVVADRVDLLHSPCLTAPVWLACPSVVTILDMIWYSPERGAARKSIFSKRKLMTWYYRVVPKQAAQQAAAVITISHASKESIVKQLGLPTGRISVTHLAASQIYRQIRDEKKLASVRQKYNLPLNFIMAIGSADPRKNIRTLVKAYASLPASLRDRFHLAIVWTHPLLAESLAEQVVSLGLNGRVHFLQQVDDNDLILLYNAAALFVFPSRYEGFGLPPLEAMACGTPVVAADNSSIPEIVGDAAVLTDADDATKITGAITQVLTDRTLQIKLIDKGRTQAANFSWEKCARQTVAAYRKVVSP